MKTFMLVLGLIIAATGFAQSAFDRVYSILQTNCTASCHNSVNRAGSLDLSGSKNDVFNALVNVGPANTAAAAKGYKRVFPGDARKSFLFVKINQGLDVNVSLQSEEGVAEPQDRAPLTEAEREMIRQWIIFGASGTASYAWVRESVINDFYSGKAEARTPALPLPAASEGFQVYFGPVFLLPGEEVEFASKFPLLNQQDLEIYKINTVVNKESHHMALWKYKPGLDFLSPAGLQKLNGISDEAVLFLAAEVVGQWPDPLEIELPQGTALLWDAGTVINLGYHIRNYSDSIIAAEIYMNIYARPRQPGTIPMLSYPVRYDGNDPYSEGDPTTVLNISPTGTDTTFVINHYQADSAVWYLWSMQAHTHQLGTDFNVWLRNPDGTKGPIIYDGSFDPKHEYDMGAYVWEHPPLRYFNPLLPVDMRNGLIHEATYRNTTGNMVRFGLKTTDEMFVTYIYYTTSQPPYTAVSAAGNVSKIHIYPNPAHDNLTVHIPSGLALRNAAFTLYDLQGRQVLTADVGGQIFTVHTQRLPSGYYLCRLLNDGLVAAIAKVTVMR